VTHVLINAAKVASALLCVAIVALWINSYRTTDLLVRSTHTGRHFEIVTIPGQLRFTIADGWAGAHGWRYFHRSTPLSYPVFGQQLIRTGWFVPGMGRRDGTAGVPSFDPNRPQSVVVTYHTLAVPFSLPLAAALILPMLWAWRSRRQWLRRERMKRGLCVECGYDLRASSGRCPECGAERTAEAKNV
jgi:hypothetical protein